jgi:hypothetical protein
MCQKAIWNVSKRTVFLNFVSNKAIKQALCITGYKAQARVFIHTKNID